MKRLALLGTLAILAATPAAIGLIGNASFSESVPVRLPAVASLLDDSGNTVRPVDSPSAHPEAGDDHGGDRDRGGRAESDDDRGRRVEPSDTSSHHAESGDDHGGDRDRGRRAESGDDHGGHGGHDGDDNSGSDGHGGSSGRDDNSGSDGHGSGGHGSDDGPDHS